MKRTKQLPPIPLHKQRLAALRDLGFPALSDSHRVNRLEHPRRPVRVVIDTDTYNEVDDQFALVYALRSTNHIQVESIYAAPFTNQRADTPAAGMQKSYDEILRLLDLMALTPRGLVHKGAESYLGTSLVAQHTAATADLIERALASSPDDPLHVVGLAAPTNIASAMLIEPRIIENIVVVWLGGHALHWPDTLEFNLRQDISASRLLLDCGVPMTLVPCNGVARLLDVSVAELDRYVAPTGPLGQYLTDTVRDYSDDHLGWSKPLWDVAAFAAFVDEQWAPSDFVSSPVLTDDVTWSVDTSRHLIKCTRLINRNKIVADLFRKIAGIA